MRPLTKLCKKQSNRVKSHTFSFQFRSPPHEVNMSSKRLKWAVIASSTIVIETTEDSKDRSIKLAADSDNLADIAPKLYVIRCQRQFKIHTKQLLFSHFIAPDIIGSNLFVCFLFEFNNDFQRKSRPVANCLKAYPSNIRRCLFSPTIKQSE